MTHLINAQPINSDTFYGPLSVRNNGGWLYSAGCKESQFYSLPFGQVVASMY